MKPDKYYGERASNYDKDRQGTRYWQREQEAIDALVRTGPVLDIPVGTARFGEIYEAKGLEWVGMDISTDMLSVARKKFPKAKLMQGDILHMPFKDKEFGTVVCNRLLYFFEPEEMQKAVRELCRIATYPVISIRTGVEGRPKNLSSYTHDLMKFYEAVGSRLVVDSRVVSKNEVDTHTVYLLREFDHQKDLVDQFQWHKGGVGRAQELADVWFPLVGINKFDVFNAPAKVEYWTHKELEGVLFLMQRAGQRNGVETDLFTDELPKDVNRPPVLIRQGSKVAMLDGRRRTNQLAKTTGITPVIVIEA